MIQAATLNHPAVATLLVVIAIYGVKLSLVAATILAIAISQDKAMPKPLARNQSVTTASWATAKLSPPMPTRILPVKSRGNEPIFRMDYEQLILPCLSPNAKRN